MNMENNGTKIALGLNNCIDYEVIWDSRTMETLVKEFDVKELDIRFYAEIPDIKGVIACILHYMRSGEGAGVKLSNMSLIHECISRFNYRTTLGGAGVRAAMAIAKLGYRSIVHLVSQSDTVRELLPASCEYYCGMDHDEEYPHLIIQFPEGAEIHANGIDIISPRANRLMMFNDKGVMTLPLNEHFFKAAGVCKVLLIGGYTSIEDHDLAMERARTTSEYIDKYVMDSVIYYEDSCPPGGLKPEHNLVWQSIVPKTDIYGMNEDELQLHVGRRIDIMDPSEVIGCIDSLSKVIPCANYLIHSKNWAILYGNNARKWIEPLQNAVDVSTTRLTMGDNMSIEGVYSTKKRQINPESLIFKKKIEGRKWDRDIACVPSYLVTDRNLTTVGLGDSFVGGFLAKLSDLL